MASDLDPPMELAELGAGRVRTAALGLVTRSKMVPPLRVRAPVLVKSSLGVFWPAATM